MNTKCAYITALQIKSLKKNQNNRRIKNTLGITINCQNIVNWKTAVSTKMFTHF